MELKNAPDAAFDIRNLDIRVCVSVMSENSNFWNGESRADGRERERLREWDFPGALNRERRAGYKQDRRGAAPFFRVRVRSRKGQVRVKRKATDGAGGGWEVSMSWAKGYVTNMR